MTWLGAVISVAAFVLGVSIGYSIPRDNERQAVKAYVVDFHTPQGWLHRHEVSTEVWWDLYKELTRRKKAREISEREVPESDSLGTEEVAR